MHLRLALLATCALTFTSLALASSASAQDRGFTRKQMAKEKRVALVIGNGAYTTGGRLTNPPNDARDLANKLRGLGFDVNLVVDADEDTMRRAIIRFGKKIKGGGVGLFYYAGHGVRVGGRNYLVPTGATLEDEELIEVETVQLADVLARMDASKNRLNVVILDACRNNPFARSWRSADRGLSAPDAPSGTFIAFATSPHNVAADGKGRNSPFTSALLENLDTPGLRIEDVFKSVRVKVEADTGGKQTPWENSSLKGDFYFNLARAAAPTCPDGTRPDGRRCVPVVVKDCPKGHEWVEGKGCVGKIVAGQAWGGSGSFGSGGLGMSGAGVGGGGGSASGSGGSSGSGSSLKRSKRSSGEATAGKPTVMGSLDPAVIKRVVRRHRREAAACYQEGLLRSPDLAGAVKVKFTISPTGAVAAAVVQSSTLKNSKVESCLIRRVKRWTFPKPKGGGLVVVSYPFTFKSR